MCIFSVHKSWLVSVPTCWHSLGTSFPMDYKINLLACYFHPLTVRMCYCLTLVQGFPVDRKSNKPAGTLLTVTDTKMAQISLWRTVTCVMPPNSYATFLWEIHKHCFRLMITIENFNLSIYLFLFHFFPNRTLRVFEFIPLPFNIDNYLWPLGIQI